MTHMIDARLDRDEDGWDIIGCGSCGWGPFPVPDIETAADMYAAHCVETALAETGAKP